MEGQRSWRGARLARGRVLVPALSLALALGLTFAASARAHSEQPAFTTEVASGPYPLVVQWYVDQPTVGVALPLLVSPAPGAAVAPSSVRLVARPGLGTNGTPIRSTLTPDPDAPGSFEGALRLPVTGAWVVDVLLDGAAGPAEASVAVTAAAPGAVPARLGWLLGLSPLAGLLWLGWWQHGYLRRLEAAGET